jgi:hypothetical protein
LRENYIIYQTAQHDLLDGADDTSAGEESIVNTLQWMLLSANNKNQFDEISMKGQFVSTDLAVLNKDF